MVHIFSFTAFDIILFETVHQNPLGYMVEKRKRNREIAQMSNEKETKGEQRKGKKTLIFYLLSFWKGLLDKLKAVMYSRLV